MGTLMVECYTGGVSDGFHSFDDLYEHRHHLFIALMRSNPKLAWRACNHEDGTMYEGGWFVAGMHLPTGDISYHLPTELWTMLDGCGIATSLRGPKWDGHTPEDTVHRLAAWCIPNTQ